MRLDDRIDDGFMRIQIRNAMTEGVKHFKIFKVGCNYTLEQKVAAATTASSSSSSSDCAAESKSEENVNRTKHILSKAVPSSLQWRDLESYGWVFNKEAVYRRAPLKLYIDKTIGIEGELMACWPSMFTGTSSNIYLFKDRYTDNHPIALNQEDVTRLISFSEQELKLLADEQFNSLEYPKCKDFQALFSNYFQSGIFSKRIDCVYGEDEFILYSFDNIYEASHLLSLDMQTILDSCLDRQKFVGQSIKFLFVDAETLASTSGNTYNPSTRFGVELMVVKYLLQADALECRQVVINASQVPAMAGANRPIYCLDRNGRLLRYFDDIHQIAIALKLPLGLLKLAFLSRQQQNEWVSFAGLFWEYADEEQSKPIITSKGTPGRAKKNGLNIPLPVIRAMIITSCTEIKTFHASNEVEFPINKIEAMMKVYCYSIDGVLLHCFRDANIAAAHLDCNPSLIIACCMNWITSYHGFGWSYTDLVNYQSLEDTWAIEECDSHLFPPGTAPSSSTHKNSCNPCRLLSDSSFLKCLSNVALKHYPAASVLQGEIPAEELSFNECDDIASIDNDIAAANSLHLSSSANENASLSFYASHPNKSAKWAKALEQEGWTLSKKDNEFIGLRVRRFFPNFGVTDGTISAYLPPEKNDNIPLWHIVHDDQDEEDLELLFLLQVMSYMQHQHSKQPARFACKVSQRKLYIHVPTFLAIIVASRINLPTLNNRVMECCEHLELEKVDQTKSNKEDENEDDDDEDEEGDTRVQFLYAILQLLSVSTLNKLQILLIFQIAF